jgi:alkylation response protein AidB-like acyl-CoA dehydrogenase
VLDGDEWVIDGQKIWTSYGHLANWMFLLTRTDPTAPKHKGINFLLVPMDQPGVEVRPIKMISGDSEFNEVFFTGARTAKENVVGAVNGGWGVAMTLLGYERGEAASVTPIMYRTELDRLIQLAREYGRVGDPVIRQKLAWCWSKVEIMRYLGMRALSQFLAGEAPGPEGSIVKIFWSEYQQVSTELAMQIMGPAGLVPTGRAPSGAFQTDDPGAPNSTASWETVFLNARAGTIYAGTSQIQRNIVGEMVLGLPKEPRGADASWAESRS